MEKTFVVVAAILVGGLIDLGAYRLILGLSSSRLNRPLRAVCGLLIIAAMWVAVPAGAYLVCLSRASGSGGSLAAVLLFIAGFFLVVVFGERGRYLRDLRKLDEQGQQVTDPADGSL
jgi:hypothetical protein